MVTVTRPRGFIVAGLVFGSVMTFLQRLTAPALGFAEHAEGFNVVLLVWWLLGGLAIMVGFVLTVIAGVGHHHEHVMSAHSKGRARNGRRPV